MAAAGSSNRSNAAKLHGHLQTTSELGSMSTGRGVRGTGIQKFVQFKNMGIWERQIIILLKIYIMNVFQELYLYLNRIIK